MNRLKKIQDSIMTCSDDQVIAEGTGYGGQSMFANVPLLPPDKIFFTKSAYKADPFPGKINLGIGAYRTNEGKPYVLKCVMQAEADLLQQVQEGKINKEYLPIGGDADFVKLSQTLILGDSSQGMAQGRVAGVQALSGTGALRILFNFVKAYNPGAVVYKSNPTWGNHRKIINKAGLEQRDYRYFKPSTRGLDFEGMCQDLSNAPRGSVVLLHACAHNPTGVDPTKQQWMDLAALFKRNGLIPLFDCAYQGYATGSLDADRFPVVYFESQGIELFIAQSYSKNMGLYGERAGCVSVVCASEDAKKRVDSQLRGIIRPMYSNPPKHGAYIAKTILGDPVYYKAWVKELEMMSNRILQMRKELKAEVDRLQTPGNWNHIMDQIGMFTFTGLNKEQVMYIRKKYHIYFLESGRISVAGLTTANVKTFAKAMDDAVRNC